MKVGGRLGVICLQALVHTHNLLSYQSAYHEGHGMETALLSVVKDILCALDEDKISVLLLLDIISGV